MLLFVVVLMATPAFALDAHMVTRLGSGDPGARIEAIHALVASGDEAAAEGSEAGAEAR